MRKLFALLIIGSVFTYYACNSAADSKDHTEHTAQNLEDSLYKSVMALHDEAMPKMGPLMGNQKTAQARLDSLTALGGASNAAMISRLSALKDQLAAAEKGMNDWMEGFDPDPQGTPAENTVYFKSEKEKAQKMRDDIFVALDSAAAILQ